MNYVDGMIAYPLSRKMDLKDMPFDGQRMIFGGFQVILEKK